jgi:hypothetical protein
MGKLKKEILFCKHPDRDVPGIECGYPLPCPFHTIEVELKKDVSTVKMPEHRLLKPAEMDRVDEIIKALKKALR